MPDQPADTRTSLLKQILVNIGGAADLGDCPDNWIQILQAIVQVYGEPTSTLADTQQQLLIQWMEGVGLSYDAAIQTEVEALTQLYLYYGGADDSTLPDHEIPLLRGIWENAAPSGPRLLVFVQPDGAVAGVAFTTQPVIHVLLTDGSLDTSFNGDITMTKFSGPGSLGGTTTVTAVSGVATFTDLSVSSEGTYKLRASTTIPAGIAGVNTHSFTCVAAASTYLRPGGVFTFRRPGGVFIYLRP